MIDGVHVAWHGMDTSLQGQLKGVSWVTPVYMDGTYITRYSRRLPWFVMRELRRRQSKQQQIHACIPSQCYPIPCHIAYHHSHNIYHFINKLNHLLLSSWSQSHLGHSRMVTLTWILFLWTISCLLLLLHSRSIQFMWMIMIMMATTTTITTRTTTTRIMPMMTILDLHPLQSKLSHYLFSPHQKWIKINHHRWWNHRPHQNQHPHRH